MLCFVWDLDLYLRRFYICLPAAFKRFGVCLSSKLPRYGCIYHYYIQKGILLYFHLIMFPSVKYCNYQVKFQQNP